MTIYTIKTNPIGIYEKAMADDFDWDTKFAIAKAAGFDFVEISVDESDTRLARLKWSDSKRAYIRSLMEKHGITINSMCLSGHRRYPFGSKDAAIRKKAYAIMDRAIALAKDLNISNIQLAGYDVYYEPSDQETIDYFVQGLQYATKQAASASVMLSIEIMDTPFIGTISKCMAFIEAINSPWLKIYPDLGNLTQWTKEPGAELEKGLPHIVAIHLKDTLPDQFKCVDFGTGTVDFNSLFSQLRTMQYTGPFLIEMWADNTKEMTVEDNIAYIQDARMWILRKAGQYLDVS